MANVAIKIHTSEDNTYTIGTGNTADPAFQREMAQWGITLTQVYGSITYYTDSGHTQTETLRIPSLAVVSALAPRSTSSTTWTLEIGEATIANTDIKEVSLNDSSSSIPTNFLYGCSALTSIDISEVDTEVVPDNFCSKCAALTSISLPSGATTIGDSYLQQSTAITSYTIPSGIVTIGNNFMKGNTSLTSITLPNSLTTIGDYFLDGATSLTTFAFTNYIDSIGAYFLNGCTSYNSDMTLPANISHIGRGFMHECRAMCSDIDVGEIATTVLDNPSTDVDALGTADKTAALFATAPVFIGSNSANWTGALWPRRSSTPYRAVYPEAGLLYVPNTDTPYRALTTADINKLKSPDFDTRSQYSMTLSTGRIKNSDIKGVFLSHKKTGVLPGCFLQLTTLEELDLSHSKITATASGFLQYSVLPDLSESFPPTLTTIGQNFCYSSSGAQTITFPPSVETVEYRFASNLRETIPSGQSANSWNVHFTCPGTITVKMTAWFSKAYEMQGTLRFDASEIVVYSSDSNAFSSDKTQKPIYTHGVTIAGPARSTILTACPNSDVSPYRKLLDGGA